MTLLLLFHINEFFFFFFFFQAEDGIRDVAVTGVQTCALPIFARLSVGELFTDETATKERAAFSNRGPVSLQRLAGAPPARTVSAGFARLPTAPHPSADRSDRSNPRPRRRSPARREIPS